MLNERSNMLYDDKQLFKSYKKFYNDDILFLEWQEQVERQFVKSQWNKSRI